MPGTVPIPTRLYHITDVSNLASILSNGGLGCTKWMQSTATAFKCAAHESIQNRRSKRLVTCGPCGTLHDYVPFYFGPRSPMLYSIKQGNVVGYTTGQNTIIYLVTTAQVIDQAGKRWVFTDGHGIMNVTEFYDDLGMLGTIDWNVMSAKYWNETEEDPDRPRRRQAEFLIHDFCDWELIKGIGVNTLRMKKIVEDLIATAAHRPVVKVKSEWYY